MCVCVCSCVCVCVCVCSQASRSRATLSCDSSYIFGQLFCTQVVSLNKLAHIRNELSWEFNVGIITPWELVYHMVFCLKFCFVSFLLNFSHVGTEPWLPGYYQYFFGEIVSCSRTQHGAPSQDRTPTLSLTTKPIRNF